MSGLPVTPRDHRIKRRENEDENLTDPETGSVKPSSSTTALDSISASCSTTALDAISEAPEDEDMISQVQ